MAVYLLHFEPPYKHARHYLGYTEDEDPQARLERHVAGRGSPLIRHALDAGCEVTLVRVWPEGDRNFERRLKNGGASTRLCPKCRAEHLERRRRTRVIRESKRSDSDSDSSARTRTRTLKLGLGLGLDLESIVDTASPRPGEQTWHNEAA